MLDIAQTQEVIYRAMRPDVILASGRVVRHRPYLSNGEPNGATEAYMVDGSNMTSEEWREYCSIIHS